MKIKTICATLLLLFASLQTGCASSGPGKTPATVEEAEKQIAKKQKKSAREAKKVQKEAYKRFWKMQTKEARKSIKKNERRQRKLAK